MLHLRAFRATGHYLCVQVCVCVCGFCSAKDAHLIEFHQIDGTDKKKNKKKKTGLGFAIRTIAFAIHFGIELINVNSTQLNLP